MIESISQAESTTKILLVDDDDEIRGLYSLVVKRKGFTAVESLSDGAEAVKAFEEDPNAADVIIMDQRMKRMDGTIASKKIKEINPTVRIIMVSGYDDLKAEDRELFERVLLKPISSVDLCDAINLHNDW
jgi:two-component system, cell cycle sensor histidine kinase and response regulator CckA